MIRQYGVQRCRGGNNPLRVDVIPVGAIVYIHDESWWRDRYRGKWAKITDRAFTRRNGPDRH